MPVVLLFAADRPPLLTFLLVAVFVLTLEKYFAGEMDGWIWLLVPLQGLWANLHGGFFLGWVVLGAYVAGSWHLPPRRRRTLWLAAGASLLVSGVNPNGWGVFEVLLNYRRSYLTSTLIEWKRPPLWGPPYTFDILLYLAAAALLLNARKVRIPDALLLLAFGSAALMAFRNVILVAFLAPVLLAAYGWPLVAVRLPRLPSSLAALAWLWRCRPGCSTASGRANCSNCATPSGDSRGRPSNSFVSTRSGPECSTPTSTADT